MEYQNDTVLDPGSDVYYVPFISDDGRVGYRVSRTDGSRETFIYFNPSDSSSDTKPNVFVYIGIENDPALDEAQHWYALETEIGKSHALADESKP